MRRGRVRAGGSAQLSGGLRDRPQYNGQPVQPEGQRGLGTPGHSRGDHWRHDVKAVLTMAHDVMISHSHKDKPAADAACAALEARGIRCWIAPRDINPGQDWAASILQAIQDARIMLLVFSRHANQSPQVNREVERAVHSGKVLLPIRIEDVLPEAALEYFLGTPHWLDAITKPFEAHLEKLADACTSLLAVPGRSPQDAASDAAPVVAALATAQSEPTTRGSVSASTPAEIQPADGRPPIALWWRQQRRQVQLGLIAASVVILAAATGITGYLLWPDSPASHTTAAQPAPAAGHTAQSALPSGPTSSTPPPVPVVVVDALDGLLLSPDQIGTAMGATAMTVTVTPTVMYDDSAEVADKACLPLASGAEAPVYAGSGWSAFREQAIHDAGATFTHTAIQSVVLFSSAHDADAFFTASAQSWPACSNRQFTITQAGKPDQVRTVGPISNTNGTLSATQTAEPGTWKWQSCQRALTVANNVAIDVEACTYNQSDSQSDSAVNIAHQIAAKVHT
jgi:hypothetical protein